MTDASVRALRLVLGDQLTESLSSLQGLDSTVDAVLMVEVADETDYVRHHPQKIVLVLAAMRHFAASLRDRGIRVEYVTLDAPGNSGSFSGEIARAVERLKPERVIVTEPGEWRVLEMMRDWRETLDVPVEIRSDDRFLCSLGEFARWADGRKQLRMEYFYREMRRKTGLLMDVDGNPEGGAWNFDSQNRKNLPKGLRPPQRLRFPPDAVTEEVISLVSERFADHFGRVDGFGYAVTRQDALRALRAFVTDCLPSFGDYQDAMKQDSPFLYHGLVSAYLNIGLLLPLEVCRAAEQAYLAGQAPLNAVEGFVRQILGWREYVRGLYWLKMPDYAATNFLNATRDLPDFYWSGETGLNCLAQSIRQTRDHAYAHHIQRLMVTGCFALLIGADPVQVNRWYMEVYIDAFEWVELPNTHGMALFADGGIMASKPYAASGKYIDRMSDYCRNCRYDVKQNTGPDACPFNALYWRFLENNRALLSRNPRMGMPYRTWAKMAEDKRAAILQTADAFLDRL